MLCRRQRNGCARGGVWILIRVSAVFIMILAPDCQAWWVGPLLRPQGISRLYATQKNKSEKNKSDNATKMNPVVKGSWYAVEAFGKMFGSSSNKPKQQEMIDLLQPPTSLQETLKRIQLDNDRSYFLSGQVDELIYDANCRFADPFVAFAGRQRFVDNLSNLGSFITKYSAKMLEYQVQDNVVTTKVMVKLQLNLPWKPILAWPWGVRYEIDPSTFQIINHEESWDIAPVEGVKQIFRKPTTSI